MNLFYDMCIIMICANIKKHKSVLWYEWLTIMKCGHIYIMICVGIMVCVHIHIMICVGIMICVHIHIMICVGIMICVNINIMICVGIMICAKLVKHSSYDMCHYYDMCLWLHTYRWNVCYEMFIACDMCGHILYLWNVARHFIMSSIPLWNVWHIS